MVAGTIYVILSILGMVVASRKSFSSSSFTFFLFFVPAVFLVLFFHAGAYGLYSGLKIASMYLIFLSSKKYRNYALQATSLGLFVQFLIYLPDSHISKINPIPAISFILLAATVNRHPRASNFLFLFGAVGLGLNVFLCAYRTQFVLCAMLIVMRYSPRSIRAYLIVLVSTIPILFSCGLATVGFILSHSGLLGGGQMISVAPTASNVERTLLSFDAYRLLPTHPFGLTMSTYVNTVQASADSLGRNIYSDTALDPHNFVSFMVMDLGIIGLFISLYVSRRTLLRSLRLYYSGQYTIVSLLLPILAIMASLYTFSTEFRLVFSVALGALLATPPSTGDVVPGNVSELR